MQKIIRACLIFTLGIVALLPQANVKAQTVPQYITQFELRDSSDTKFPHIATFGNRVYASINRGQQEVALYTKTDSATDFAPAELVGPAMGQPDFSSAAVAVDPRNGVTYIAWSDTEEKRIYVRSRNPDGVYGPIQFVSSSVINDVIANLDVGVASDGAVFVVWREISKPIYYKRSTNGGADFRDMPALPASNPDPERGEEPYNSPIAVTTGPAGQVALTYTAARNDRLQIFIALWNGNGFDNKQVTSSDNGSFADSGASYGPDGKLYVAWRGAGDGAAGAYYAEYQPGNTPEFPISRFYRGVVSGIHSVAVDAQRNLHFGWLAKPSGDRGPNQILYVFKSPTGDFSEPIFIPIDDAALFNPRIAANTSDRAYGHIVAEAFTGRGAQARYSLVATGIVNVMAQPNIENGAPQVGNKNTVSVNFTTVGNPTQIRWRWGAPPDDATNDSGGWQNFTNPQTLPIPQAILDSTACTPVTLFTQVRAGDAIEKDPKSDQIVVDAQVNVTLDLFNPESRAALPNQGLITKDGDLNYTRSQSVYLTLDGKADCNLLSNLSLGPNSDTQPVQVPVNAVTLTQRIEGLTFLTPGTNNVSVLVRDTLNNTRAFNEQIIYDPVPPVLNLQNPGILTSTQTTSTSLIVDLEVVAANVTDNIFNQNARQFWGVAIANSRTSIITPTNTPNLKWLVAPVTGKGNSFRISGWNLASGLADQDVTTGRYYVYLRFVDGAGNMTNDVLRVAFQVESTHIPSLFIPMVR